jgi:hypothetical protein
MAGEVADVDQRDRRVIRQPRDARMPQRVEGDGAVLGNGKLGILYGLRERPPDIAMGLPTSGLCPKEKAGAVLSG